jgi:hypothetical protein
MNRITRMLTITGLGLVTGLTIGAGPAMASTATGQGTSPSATSATQVQDVDRRHDRDRDRVVGFFRSYRACDWAGERGEDRNRWDDYDCEPRGFGFNRRWALEVSWDRHHRWNDDNNNNDDNNDNDHWHH